MVFFLSFAICIPKRVRFLFFWNRKLIDWVMKLDWLEICKVWIIKNETLSEIENGIASVIFDQSLWNFVKITIENQFDWIKIVNVTLFSIFESVSFLLIQTLPDWVKIAVFFVIPIFWPFYLLYFSLHLF